MSGIQASICITAGPPGAFFFLVNLLAGADDGSMKLTAEVLTREEASQVFTKTAIDNFQSPASDGPVLTDNTGAHINVSSNAF